MRFLTFLILFLITDYFQVPEMRSPRLSKHHQTGVIVPPTAQKLIASYPNFIAGYADNHIIFKDKTIMIWDDGIVHKSFEQLLAKPDLKDMFDQRYVKGELTAPPVKNFDPGRIRNEPFFLKMYGQTKKDVESNLVEINWCPKLVGQKIMVTRINGVDKKFMKISEELDEHPELKKYLINIAGTFSWRYIAGTTRQSMHSFGMTVDINTYYSDYWEWACKCVNEDGTFNYQNRIPQKIVDIFEKHGFVWGGKWYHFDTMHFEYRPELLAN